MIKYIIIAALVFSVGGIIAMICITSEIAKRVYYYLLVRDTPDKWKRVCSAPENEEQLAMWNDGLEWGESNRSVCKKVSIQNEGLKLAGEFFDFGYDKCVIILPGRCECLKYSYYYAAPYKEVGVNVLVTDSRCHGESEGTYSTIGVAESRDAIAWAEYLHDKEGMKEIYFHGICLGAAASIFVAANENAPSFIKAMVCEGCFVDFRESFKNHMIADKRPLFPVLDLVMLNIKKHTGVNVLKDSPINAVKKADIPVLFIFGKKDLFSLPKKSLKLIEAYAGKDKFVKWLPEGGHSHLRINNTEDYDRAVMDFINNLR